MTRTEMLDWIEAQAAKMMETDGYHKPIFFVHYGERLEIVALASEDPSEIRTMARGAAEKFTNDGATMLTFIAEVWSRDTHSPTAEPQWSLCIQCADASGVEIRTYPVTKDAAGGVHVGPRGTKPVFDPRAILSNLPWRTP
jgi:hypothetical protein